MDIVRIVLGAVVLTLGRRLFWLFVAVVGFALGVGLATQFFGGQPDWLILIIGLVAGLLGALLAVFIQQVAIGLAGFIGGGYIAVYLLNVLDLPTGQPPWLPFIVGGIIGAVLVAVLFDPALIVLSSLVGASLILQAIQIQPVLEMALFALLVAVGIVIQAGLTRSRRPRSSRTARNT